MDRTKLFLNHFPCVFILCMHEQTKLEKKVAENLCRSMVYEVLQGVRSPERPSSPPELYITEEQEFWIKNPKVHTNGRFYLTLSQYLAE